jgi:hypothetical protein
MGNQIAMGRRFGGKGWVYPHSYEVQGLFFYSKDGKNCGLQVGYLSKN